MHVLQMLFFFFNYLQFSWKVHIYEQAQCENKHILSVKLIFFKKTKPVFSIKLHCRACFCGGLRFPSACVQ